MTSSSPLSRSGGLRTPQAVKRRADAQLSGDAKRAHLEPESLTFTPTQARFEWNTPMNITPRTAKSYGLTDETATILGKRLTDIKSISELLLFTKEWLRQSKGPLDNPTDIGELLKLFLDTLVIL
jgi:hypothetical protein